MLLASVGRGVSGLDLRRTYGVFQGTLVRTYRNTRRRRYFQGLIYPRIDLRTPTPKIPYGNEMLISMSVLCIRLATRQKKASVAGLRA